jgi:hypothetical protein
VLFLGALACSEWRATGNKREKWGIKAIERAIHILDAAHLTIKGDARYDCTTGGFEKTPLTASTNIICTTAHSHSNEKFCGSWLE